MNDRKGKLLRIDPEDLERMKGAAKFRRMPFQNWAVAELMKATRQAEIEEADFKRRLAGESDDSSD